MNSTEPSTELLNATSLADRTIHNPENRVGVSSYDKQQMTVNPDGSVDVYIGPIAPDGLTSNWIPTAGKDFWLIARFYGPDKVLFKKAWVMPDVEKVS